jgi:SAM-dependent methyltransferase
MSAAAARSYAVDTAHFGRIPVVSRPCPLCGKENDAAAATRYSDATWAVKACRGCGFVYIDPAPDYAAQYAQIAWEVTTKVEEGRRAEIRPLSYAASKRTRFRMHLLPRRTMAGIVAARISAGNVVDLGCGEGAAMAGFPPGFVPFGIEISSAAARQADALFRARGGYAVNAPCVEGLKRFPAGFFHAATLRSYLEHEQHPAAVLEALHRVLAPEGFAVVKVPNFGSLNRMVMGRRWCGFRYPDHLNYFTPASLRALARQCGFRAEFGLFGRLPTSDNMWATLVRSA